MALPTYGTMAVDWENRVDLDRLRHQRHHLCLRRPQHRKKNRPHHHHHQQPNQQLLTNRQPLKLRLHPRKIPLQYFHTASMPQ